MVEVKGSGEKGGALKGSPLVELAAGGFEHYESRNELGYQFSFGTVIISGW